MAEQSLATPVTSTCACGCFKLEVRFPTSSLPLDRALCLCNSCRRLSGSCGISNILIPRDQPFDPLKYALTKYKSSEALDRYFCSTCGAHAIFNHVASGNWYLATGLWDRTEGVIRWNGCKWVEPTLDGGVSVWFNSIKDQDGSARQLRRWMLQDGDNEEVPPGAFREYKRSETGSKSSDYLKAACHCGGVQFQITRPNEASKRVKSPYSDCIVPFHTGESSDNPENNPWWLCCNDTKYFAGTCACTSCRKSLGFEIQTWAFIPKPNILQPNGEPMSYDMGTLKRYSSSKDVMREFCGVCGATVFWHCLWRPDLVDVSVGLFDPEEGARVESWLEWWTGRVSFEEMAVSTSLVKSLQGGFREWGDKRRST